MKEQENKVMETKDVELDLDQVGGKVAGGARPERDERQYQWAQAQWTLVDRVEQVLGEHDEISALLVKAKAEALQ